MKVFHGSLVKVEIPKILPRQNGHTCDFGTGVMTEVTQSNLRSLLSVKDARVILKIKQNKNISLKEAYLKFFGSNVYKQLEVESTKRWWQSAEQIFEDGISLGEF